MRSSWFLFTISLFACDRSKKGDEMADMPAMAPSAPQAASADPHAAHGTATPGAVIADPSVEVSSSAITSLGIRTEPAAGGEARVSSRVPATVAWDLLQVVRVSTQAGGHIRTLSVPRPGESVSKGQVLARLFQPELRGAFAELLVARDLGEPWLGAARARVGALGASLAEINTALTSGEIPETTAVRAPSSGVVLERSAAEGAWIAPGAPIVVLGDPNALVVEAEVSGTAPATGTAVTLRDVATGQAWPATVSSTLPTASAVGVRIRLQPEGVVPVGRPLVAEWQTVVTGGVWVPREALVDTGERRVVFVEERPGHFAPRKVEIGARAGDRVQILSGIVAGEPVVVSGTFLLDSETQIGSMGHAGHGG
jgi:Cu(I)/Ag(I) efflux system membrane fusion protein